jgi:hypothetical protein
MVNESVDPSTSGNLDPNFNPDIQMASSPQVAGSRQLLVTPTESYIMSEQQKEFVQRAQAADMSTKLTPIYDKIEQIKQDINVSKEQQSKQLNDNKVEYDRLKAEADQLQKSQEGMVGGEYKLMHIGYDDLIRDINTQKTSLDVLQTQLQDAQKAGDQGKVDALLGRIDDTSNKLKDLMRVNPWDPSEQKYAPKSIERHFINPPVFASGWGVGGYSGYGEGSGARRDILEGSVTGLTVGASTPETRAQAAAEAAAKAGAVGAPEVTADYVSSLLTKFSANPYDSSISQRDQIILSAYRQMSDPTAKLSVSGLSSIAQQLIDSGVPKASALAIIASAPQGQGSAAYQAVGAVLEKQAQMQSKLHEQILAQPVKAVIAAPLTVGLGETGAKKPFLSTLSVPTPAPMEKPVDYLAGIKSLFAKTPLGATLIGTPEEKKEAEKTRTQLERITNMIAPAMMVSGGGVKVPATAPTTELNIFDRLFGVKSGAGDIIKGISISAIIPGTLAIKGEKTANASYESGKPAFTGIKVTDIVGTIVPLPVGAKQAPPLETGIFSKAFFASETPSQLRAGSLSPEKWTSVEQMGGGKNKESYASFKAIPSDIDKAFEFKYDNNSRTGYAFVDKSGTFQVLVDSGIWKSSSSEAGWQGLLSKGVDPIQTALNEKGEQVKGTPSDVAVFLQTHGKPIDVKDPAVLDRFYANMQAKQNAVINLNAGKAADMDLIQRHRYERNSGLPVNSLSESMWKDIQARQAAPVTLTNVGIKSNVFGTSSYDVKLNTTDPYAGLQFQTPKSERVAGMLSTLSGEPLTASQRDAITKESNKLPLEDKIVADRFLNIYDNQTKMYDKVNSSFQDYDYSDTARSKLLGDITEYSKYSPEGARTYLTMLQDVDTGKKIQDSNTKIIDAAETASPYAFNMVLTNGKLVPSTGGRDKLDTAIAEQKALLTQIKTPSIREQVQTSIDDAVKFGKVRKEMNTPDPSGQKSFNSLVDSLKLIPPEQKSTLKVQYENYAEAKVLSEKADKLLENAPRTGISDKDLTDLKLQLSKNPVLTQINPKTDKSYSDEITTGLEKVKSGYWNEETYRKEVPYDFITGAGFSLRASGQESVEKEGANWLNVGKSAFGGLLATPGATIYGTVKSMLPMIGQEGAQETTQQSATTKAVMPSWGGIAGLGDTIAAPHVDPYTKPIVPYARGIGTFIGETGTSIVLGPTLARESGAKDFWGKVGGEFLAAPVEKPVSAGMTYAVGYGIGKIFEGISAAKTGLLITPRLAKNEARIAEIEIKLGKTEAGLAQAEGTVFPKATRANPLARAEPLFGESKTASEATRAALFTESKAIERSTRLLKLADTGIDLAIGAPFLVGMGTDLYSTRMDPMATGEKLSNLAIMGMGASNLIGKQTIMGAKISQGGGGASGWSAEGIGLKTRPPGGEVETFRPLVSIVKSPTEGVRLPFTSKEYGYSLKVGTPEVYSVKRDIIPARQTMSATDEAFYQQLVKDLAPDARAQAEMPGLLKTSRIKRTDALTQEVLTELNKIDRTKYNKLKPGELEVIAELSAKYKDIGNFDSGITPSGKILPAEADVGILSAEMVRQSKAFKDVNQLSPLGRSILYETIRDANSGKAQTPLARILTNAEDKVSGKKQTYHNADINMLPTNAERIFGEARMKTMNSYEARITEKAFRDKEAHMATKAQFEQIKLQKRIDERNSVINKIESEVLQRGKAQITKNDIDYLGIDVKPAADGKYYINEQQFFTIKDQIAKEEQQLTFLGQNRERALEFDFNSLISQEVRDFDVKSGQNETLFLTDQFAQPIGAKYTSGPGYIKLTAVDRIIKTLGGKSEKQYINADIHTHPRPTPLSPADMLGVFNNPSTFSLTQLVGVKSTDSALHVITQPRTLTKPKQFQSWTQPKTENFIMEYQGEIGKVHKGAAKPESVILSAYQDAIYNTAFGNKMDYFKLMQEKPGSAFKVAPEHFARVDTAIVKSLNRLRGLEEVKRKAIVEGKGRGTTESAISSVRNSIANVGKSIEKRDITSADQKTMREGEQVVTALKQQNVVDAYLKQKWGERAEEVALRPESQKIHLERELQRDTSGVQLDPKKHFEPAIKAMLDDKKVPNSEKVAREIMKGLEDEDAILFGSLIQDATLREMTEKKLPYNVPITRSARDIDAHLTHPNIAAYKLTDIINRAANDKVVEVKEGNPAFTKKYDAEQSKLFDLHDIDAETMGGTEGAYIGRGMITPSRMTLVRKPLIMEGGSLKAITLSEQSARKFEGSGVITPTKTRTITTEEGVTTTGSMIPEHLGRLKDVTDSWQLKQMQADLLEARGSSQKAARVRENSDKWLSLYGESVVKDAHAKAKQAQFDYLNDIGYNTKTKKMVAPSPVTSSAALFTPQKKSQPSQMPKRSSMKLPSSSIKYISQGYKSPYPYRSASRSPMASRLSSLSVSSAISSAISPSPSAIKSPSPSPSPSISRSPSPSISSMISPSPSVSKSPSPYVSVSPSIYRSPSKSYISPPYPYPKIEMPGFGFGLPGGGGGGDSEKRKIRLKRRKIFQPIRTGRELMTGFNMPEFTYNLGGEPANVNNSKLRKRIKKLYA